MLRIDPLSARCLSTLHPTIRPRAEDFIVLVRAEFDVRGIDVCITQGTRTIDEQNALYEQGRNGNPGPIVTWVRGGFSWHNHGLAFDVAVDHDMSETKAVPKWPNDKSIWGRFHEIGHTLGLETIPNDLPHFQYRGGLNIQQAIAGMRPTKICGVAA